MYSQEITSLPPKSEELGKIIRNTKEPLIIKEIMDCELTRWDLEQWKLVLGEQMLKFRCGQNTFTKEPQWESTCSIKESNFESFLKHIQTNSKEWQYFDYKHLNQWITDSETLQEKIDWSALGFPAVNFTDTTIWIGSKGAHTLCHKDTYSCNIVLQVFGRKEWLLFPPDQNLKPTRIPFEESTVFSKLNFFSPIVNKEYKDITGCRKVILNPGDILVVPNKWWHYVENLDTAISINTWIPLPEDDFERIKEGVASIFVEKIGSLFNGDYLLSILNPNMTTEMLTSEANLLTLNLAKVDYIKKCQEEQLTEKTDKSCDVQSLLDKYATNVFQIPVLTGYEFESFLKQKASRFDLDPECEHEKDVSENRTLSTLNNFLEVITNDDVLTLIARKFVKTLWEFSLVFISLITP